jgi:hypothetical protein
MAGSRGKARDRRSLIKALNANVRTPFLLSRFHLQVTERQLGSRSLGSLSEEHLLRKQGPLFGAACRRYTAVCLD